MTGYTLEEQAMIIMVLKEKVEGRLRRGNGRCLLGVQCLKKAVAANQLVRNVGLTGNKTMTRFILKTLRTSNLLLREFGHSTPRTFDADTRRRVASESELIFSVEGIKNDDRGLLVLSPIESLHIEWSWPLSPKPEQGGIESDSVC